MAISGNGCQSPDGVNWREFVLLAVVACCSLLPNSHSIFPDFARDAVDELWYVAVGAQLRLRLLPASGSVGHVRVSQC